MANPVLEFDNHRVRDDSTGLNTDGGWYHAENSRFTLSSASTAIRVRATISETASKSNTGDIGWQYRWNSGSWTNVTTSSLSIRYVNLAQTEGGALTTQLLSNGQGTWGADGLYGETTLQTLNYTKLEFNEIENALSLNTLTTYQTGDTIELRPYDSTSGFLTVYNSLVTIDIEVPAAGPQTFSRDLSDSLTLTDTLVRDVDNLRLLLDSLTLTDTLSATTIQASQTFSRTLADSLTLTDNLTRTVEHVRSLSDSLTLTDSLNATRTRRIYGYIRRAGRM